MKIEKKLIMFFMFVSILSVLAVAVSGYIYTKKELTSSLTDEMTVYAEGYGRNIEDWLLRKSDMVINTETLLHNLAPTGNLDSTYLAQKANDKNIEMLYVGLTDRRIITDSNWNPPAGYDPTSRSWYKEALAANALVYSDPYIDASTNEYVVTISIPFKGSAGEVRGVVAADILLSSLVKSVEDININGQGFAFLLDKNATVLAHPNADFLAKKAQDIEVLSKIAPTIMSNQQGITDYVYNGVDNIVAYQKIPLSGWVLCISISKENILGQLNSLAWIFIIVSFVMVVISFIVATIMSKRFTKPVVELTNNAKLIAGGDLTVRANVQGTDEIAELVESFNQMSHVLNNIIQKILSFVQVSYHTAQNLKTASLAAEEMVSQMNTVSKSSDNQLQSVMQGVELVGSMRQVVENISLYTNASVDEADKVKHVVQSGLEAIEKNNAVMRQSIDAFHQVSASINILNDKSHEVGNIVNMISSIAGQTNLLALNAAIEAARAGTHGQGFAVVAEEVRKLSEQAADSSKQIVGLILEIQSVTKELVENINMASLAVRSQEEAVNMTKNSFDQIYGVVDTIVDKIRDVASQTQELNGGMSKVNVMISEVADITENSAAQAEEVTASIAEQTNSIKDIAQKSHELVLHTKNLESEISKFKTINEQNHFKNFTNERIDLSGNF